jgi:hypothetical protein
MTGNMASPAEANENSAEGATNSAAPCRQTSHPMINYRAGMQLRVPNIGADRFDPAAVKDKNWATTLQMLGVGTDQPQAASIEVDKSDQVLRVLDANGKLIAQYTATMGSEKFRCLSAPGRSREWAIILSGDMIPSCLPTRPRTIPS